MSSSRVQPPPVNLKERIAALQQRSNGSNGSATQRSLSPSPQPISSLAGLSSPTATTSPTSPATGNTQIPATSALREKIARFEKKGGIPVPRGSFGLGAPPPSDAHGPRRQNELYGNRIPQPLRVVSSGSGIPQRRRDLTTTPTTGVGAAAIAINNGSGVPAAAPDKRRSVSLSNVNVTPAHLTVVDYDDDEDHNNNNTPLTSPVFPSSPPESPYDATLGDVIPNNHHPLTTTIPLSSFTTVLESAEAGEETLLDSTSPLAVTVDPPETADAIDAHVTAQAPIVPPEIVVSVEEEEEEEEEEENPSVAQDTTPTELPPVQEEEDVQEVTVTQDDPIPLVVDGDNNDEDEDSRVTNDESHSFSESQAIPPPPPVLPSEKVDESTTAIPDVEESSSSPEEDRIPIPVELPPIAVAPSEPIVILSPSTPTSPVPSTTQLSEQIPLIQSTAFNHDGDDDDCTDDVNDGDGDDDKSAVIPPVMDISPPLSPAGSDTQSELPWALEEQELLPNGSIPAVVVAAIVDAPLQEVTPEPEPEPEPKARKAPPPALLLLNGGCGGITLPSSPPPLSSALPSSPLERTTGSTGSSLPEVAAVVMVAAQDNLVKEDPEVVLVEEEVENVVEVVVSAEEEDEEDDHGVVQMPSSPTTPHAPQFTIPPPNPEPVAPVHSLRVPPPPPPQQQQQPSSLLLPSSSRETPVRPATMFELSSPSSSSSPGDYPPLPPLPTEKDIVNPRARVISETHINDEQQREEEERGELGSVTILPHSTTTGSSSRRQQPSSFKAVVHHKIREVPPMPQTPHHHIRRALSAVDVSSSSSSASTIIPPSPGFTDLAVLLQSTVLLEQTLEQGTLPTESRPTHSGNNDSSGNGGHQKTTATTAAADSSVEIRRLSREEVEESRRTLAKLQAKREEQAKSKIRNTLRNTFARATSTTKASAAASLYGDDDGLSTGGGGMEKFGSSTTTLTSENHHGDGGAQYGQHPQQQQQQQQQQYYSKRFKSPSAPYLLDSVHEDSMYGLVPKTPERGEFVIGVGKPPSLMSNKSPKSRFPSFRRLASKSSSSSSSREGYGSGGGGLSSGHGHMTRNSVSTSSEISSEDSAPMAVTPPDGEFGERGGGGGVGLVSWPSVSSASPKRMKEGKENSSGMARAATFAGKIWQRARTKSGGSTLSAHSSSGRMSSEPPPALPPLPDIILPLSDSGDRDVLVQPPIRSTSLKPSPLPPLPSKSPEISFSLSLDLEHPSRSSTPQPSTTRSSSLAPDSPSSLFTTAHGRRRMDNGASSSSRPMSWVSASSSGSNLNSSVLDSELFDAFPSVPENYPLVLPPSLSYAPSPSEFRQHDSQLGAGLMHSSFDTSMISSAAHLHGEQGRVRGGPGDSSFLSSWSSPPESVNTLNGGAKAWGGIPPSR